MKPRKLVLLLLVLLLVAVGVVAAQSSASFVLQRFVAAGGGHAESTNYKVTSVVGQQTTDVADAANYRLSAGFLHPIQHDSSGDNKNWLPMIRK